MKNTICIIICTLFFWSCQSDNLENVKKAEQTAEYFDRNVTYPMDITTRSTDELSTSWETIDQIILPSGSLVYTPWNTNYSKSTIPTEYRSDIKKADGWNLIAHTVNGEESGLNYLFFYNRFTGMLKVFYYLEHSYSQTTGLWHVYIDKPQNLLAFTNSIAYTIDSSHKIQDVYCSNITINKDKAFTEGWNCFELELAYDPQFKTGTLIVEPCGIIQSNLTITGNYNSKSDGNIITINSEKTGVLKGTGSDAKKYIANEVPKVSKEFGNLSSLTESSPLSDFIQKGIGKLFKSFSALTKRQKPQEYKLQFTTSGSVELNGTITTNLGGGFSPITINISNDKVGKLGLWNLVNQPTIQFNTLGRHIATSDVTFPTFRIYGAGKEFYNISINPDAVNGIIGCSDSYKIFIGDNSECLSPGGRLVAIVWDIVPQEHISILAYTQEGQLNSKFISRV